MPKRPGGGAGVGITYMKKGVCLTLCVSTLRNFATFTSRHLIFESKPPTMCFGIMVHGSSVFRCHVGLNGIYHRYDNILLTLDYRETETPLCYVKFIFQKYDATRFMKGYKEVLQQIKSSKINIVHKPTCLMLGLLTLA